MGSPRGACNFAQALVKGVGFSTGAYHDCVESREVGGGDCGMSGKDT